MAEYTIYPALDEALNFPPGVRSALLSSTEFAAKFQTERNTTNAKFQTERDTTTSAISTSATNERAITNNRFDSERATTTAAIQASAGNYRVDNLQYLQSALFNSAIPVGSIVRVGYGPVSNQGGVVYRSLWLVDAAANGAQGFHATPLDDVPILVDSTDTMAKLVSAIGNSGYWAAWMTCSHKHTVVSVETAYHSQFRWNANTGNFGLWPNNDAHAIVSYNGGSDQPLLGGSWTNHIWDTIDMNGLNAQLTDNGTRVYLPYAGRYEFTWQWGITNDDTQERYISSVANDSVNNNIWTGHPGAYNYRPMLAYASWSGPAGSYYRFQSYRAGSGSQWRTRGTDYQNKPRVMIRFVGWD